MSQPDFETDPELQTWLEAFLAEQGGVAGTIHRRSDADADWLQLVAAVNIPPKVIAITTRIPRGKGMAGLALERETAVSTCDLKTDETGDVRPGAKAVDASAAVALPVRDASGTIAGVVGIAYQEERPITDELLATLAEATGAVFGRPGDNPPA